MNAGKAPDSSLDSSRIGAPSRLQAVTHVTPEDRGLVEMPRIAPHFEVRPLGGEAAIMVSENFNAILYGRRYVDLLPLLDGTRSRREVTEALEGKHQPVEIQTALVSLATRGYLVSGDFAMDEKAAAFWCSLGVSPRRAEAALGASRVAVRGDAGPLGEALAGALRRMGLRVAGRRPTLVLHAVADYLDPRLERINRRHLDSGVPWIPLCARGMLPAFGPVFRPAGGGPCWSCLAHRLRGNREVESFLRHFAGDSAAVLPRAAAPPFADAVVGLAAVEVAKWVVAGSLVPLHENAVSVSPYGPGVEHHHVMRRPQCAVCGEEGLHLPSRPAAPVELGPSPKPVRNSGGNRSVPPEETVRRYRHLLSPLSGVVTQLLQVSEPEDPWLHVYWAGSNLALKNDSLRLLRNSLRTKSSGKGSTPQQAEASALCEAVERYSGVFHGDEIRTRRSFDDFSDGEAIHPNEVQLYSEWQYDNAERINALGSRFNHVPERFAPDAPMDWSPVWSLTEKRQRHLPTMMLYFATPLEGGTLYCGPDSNGCAAGNTLEEAILQGFFELVERDAFACWWYNRAKLPEVDLDSFDDPYLRGMREYYGRWNRDAWLLDATNDFGIPVFVAVSRRTDKEAEDILYSAGAHFDPRIAALRAVCELNQYLGSVRNVEFEGGDYQFDDPEALWWWRNAKLADHPYLAPDAGAPKRAAAGYPVPGTDDVRDDVELCRSLVEGKGMEFLVLDQTRPDIGMPVARTIVPGMRHFWARFAPGRLYDVPVEMGWLEKPTAHADLNPVMVFI